VPIAAGPHDAPHRPPDRIRLGRLGHRPLDSFRSTGFAFTLISWDLPKGARLIAQENASDANLPNTVVQRDTVFPYLGPFDWLLDIVGMRYAVIEGTWGFEQGGDEGPGSLPTGSFGG
jgi:hypothetical protein